MIDVVKKRGYYKWTDEDGVKHKVHESEYEAVDDIVKQTEELPEEGSSDAESD